MSMTVDIFEAARKCFGNDVFKQWKRLSQVWENVLWQANYTYGPLNEAQRNAFVQVVCDRFVLAKDHPNPLAFWLYTMARMQSDETLSSLMKQYRDVRGPNVALPDEILGRIGE